MHGLGLQFSRDASRRPTAIYRRDSVIAIGVYIDGEEVLDCLHPCRLGVAFREIGRIPGCEMTILRLSHFGQSLGASLAEVRGDRSWV
jgi:hypothetical protein